MRTDTIRLEDIYDAIERIERFVSEAGGTQTDVMKSQATLSAIQYQLLVIGEAAAHVSDELKQQHASLPWHGMKAMQQLCCPPILQF